MSTNGEHVVGFIDLGTNSVRLLLARTHPDRAYTVLNRVKEVVRLGEGEFLNNRLQPLAMRRAALVCRKFVEMASSFQAETLVAVATSASRDARNKDAFLRRLRRDAGLDVRVISGKEEARLIYLGVSSGVNLADRQALFIDIGGGSTELVVGDQQQYSFLDSLNLGAIRLNTMFFDATETGPVSENRYRKIQRYIRKSSVRTIQRLKKFPVELAIGSSGTLMNLAEIAARHCDQRSLAKQGVLTHENLKQVVAMLRSLPIEERAKVSGINPERADIIISGAAIADVLMEELGLAEIQISDRGLREGMPIDYLSRGGLQGGMDRGSFRERSVLQLGHTCGFDEEHGRNVARLALQLFDSSREAGLHKFGDWERELLEYAALLHDIGVFLSYNGHRSHSYYFIRNAELLGFDQTEISVIAATAYYHHKSYPRLKHPQFAELDKKLRKVVRVLCVLLRMAESLDRSHARVVTQATLRKVDRKHCVLDVTSSDNCELELWGIQDHAKTFYKSFKKRLAVNLVSADGTAEPEEKLSAP